MLHRDRYDIEVTDKDIDQAMVEVRHNPIQLACARAMNKSPEEIDIKHNGVFVSVYDYADYIKYTFDENCRGHAGSFLALWAEWVDEYEDDDDAICYCEPFTCQLNLSKAI